MDVSNGDCHRLVTLEDSSWAEEFSAFGSQLIPRDQFTHWAIGASNYIVEVLAVAEPRTPCSDPKSDSRSGDDGAFLSCDAVVGGDGLGRSPNQGTNLVNRVTIRAPSATPG